MADNNSPKFVAYSVRKREGAKSVWTRIGAVFEHEDGLGETLLLDALPIGREIVLRVPQEKDEEKAA
ncbi:MAG: hypothetical protein DHS20C08_11680 [Rhodomicrobium sp.]|jgi:hypothetical protein|nr:MAG: hypothetical protein DHS20C08_11680 [Rhodomicrobium sp.]